MLRQAAALSGPGGIFTLVEGEAAALRAFLKGREKKDVLAGHDGSYWACHWLIKLLLRTIPLKLSQLFSKISPDEQMKYIQVMWGTMAGPSGSSLHF